MKLKITKAYLTKCKQLICLAIFCLLLQNAKSQYGNGTAGDVVINTSNNIVNNYYQVLSVGYNNIQTLGNTNFYGVASKFLLYQTTGINAGNWEVVSITGSGNNFNTSTPITNVYGGGLIQLIEIPEYNKLTIESTGSITCLPYNSTTGLGGVVMFMVKDSFIINNGQINVTGKGYPANAGGVGATGGVGGLGGNNLNIHGSLNSIANTGLLGGGNGGLQMNNAANGFSAIAATFPGTGLLAANNSNLPATLLMGACGNSGSGGNSGKGAGGGGAGVGSNGVCNNGGNGGSGGNGGNGGQGGNGGGLIFVIAKKTKYTGTNLFVANGENGQVGTNATAGGNGGNGGDGCGTCTTGGAGGGGNGANGGDGGNGGNGGAAGKVFVRKMNGDNLTSTIVQQNGGLGGAGGVGGAGGSAGLNSNILGVNQNCGSSSGGSSGGGTSIICNSVGVLDILAIISAGNYTTTTLGNTTTYTLGLNIVEVSVINNNLLYVTATNGNNNYYSYYMNDSYSQPFDLAMQHIVNNNQYNANWTTTSNFINTSVGLIKDTCFAPVSGGGTNPPFVRANPVNGNAGINGISGTSGESEDFFEDTPPPCIISSGTHIEVFDNGCSNVGFNCGIDCSQASAFFYSSNNVDNSAGLSPNGYPINNEGCELIFGCQTVYYNTSKSIGNIQTNDATCNQNNGSVSFIVDNPGPCGSSSGFPSYTAELFDAATNNSLGQITSPFNNLAPGTYYLKEPCGNSFVQSSQFTINSSSGDCDSTCTTPTISTTTNSVCSNSSLQLNASPTNGTWTVDDASKGEVYNSIFYPYTTSGNVVVTYSVGSGANVCSASITLTIVDNSLPQIQGIGNTCINTSANYSNSFNGGTWSWDNPTRGSIMSAGSNVILNTNNLTGGGNLTYSATINGCNFSVSRYINIIGSGSTVSGPTEICAGRFVNYTSSVGGGIWSISNASAGNLYSQTSPFLSFSPSNQFSGNVTLSYNSPLNGCVSNNSIDVLIKPRAFSTTYIQVCQDQLPYSWNNVDWYYTGRHTMTFTATNGCDSFATLDLTVNNTTSSITNQTICTSALPFSWNGNSYSQAGTYNVTLVNASGCDSVATLVLTTNVCCQPTSSTTNVSVCGNQLPYNWNNNNYSAVGTYTVTLANSCGMDSIATLNLIVNQESNSTTTIRQCNIEFPYSWNGLNINNDGTYSVTLTNTVGCDSIATLILINDLPTFSNQTVLVCSDKLPFKWNGNDYTQSGTYSVTLTNAAGCDSIASLELTVNNCCINTYSTTTVNLCSMPKTGYVWNGQTFNTAGTHTVNLVNAEGCDSIATLILIVNQVTFSSTNITACNSYTWNGNTYNSSGNYSYTTTGSNGCDSIATLILTITPTPNVTLTNTSNPCDNPQVLVANGIPNGASIQWQYNSTNVSGTSSIGGITELLGPNATNDIIEPVLLCRDAAGNIYVPESGRHRIVRIDAITGARTVVAGTGTLGTSLNQLREPCAVTLDGNDMIITDHWNHRILRWTIGASSGTVIAGITGTSGSAVNELYFPLNAVVGPNGNLYVADRSNNRVMEYTPGNLNGTAIITGLSGPHDIDFINNNEFLVTNRYGGNVLSYNLSTNATSIEYSGLSQPYAMFVHTNGDRYLTQVGNNTLSKINNGTNTLNIIANNSVLNYPAGVTLNNNNCPVISDYGNARVISICPTTFSYSATQTGAYTAIITHNGCTTNAGPIQVTMPSIEERNEYIVGCGEVLFNGNIYTTSTTVNTTIKDKNGCDSVLIRNHIEVKEWSYENEVININACGNAAYNGIVYTNSTVLYDTVLADEIKCRKFAREININITPWTNNTKVIDLDSCGSITYNNVVYTQSTTLNWTITDSTNCTIYDTTVNINVTPWTIEEVTNRYTGCGSVLVDDIRYFNDTVLYDTIIKPSGCIKYVYITIIDVFDYQYNVTTTNLSGCGSVTHNGITYTQSTILSDTIDVSIDTICKKNVNTVNITITPWTIVNDTTRLSGCGTVVYKGITYTASTILSNTSENTTSCTRTNTIIIITVTPWMIFNDTTRVTGCDSALFNNVWYRNNDTIRTSNVREDSCIRRNSVVIITVNPSPIFTLTNTSNVCDNQQNISVGVNGGINGNTISWMRNGVSYNPTVNNAPVITTVAGGNGAGSNANQLSAPFDFFVDDNENIFVADATNNRIQKFAKGSTNGVTVAGGNGIGSNANQLYSPNGIFVDGSGNIFVADYGNHRIQKFAPSSTIGVTVGGGNGIGSNANQLNLPSGIFVDGSSNIYVADLWNHRIQKFSQGNPNGITVAGGNHEGSNANQLYWPTDVWVDATGNIYVADSRNHRIQKFLPGNPNGVTVAGGNGVGSNANQFHSPTGIFVDGIGNINVADLSNHRIQKFASGSTNGVTVAGGNGSGSNANQLNAPYSTFVDGKGNIFIADRDNNRIQKILSPNTTSNYFISQSGTYTVTVTNQFGCSSTQTINVSIPAPVVRDTVRINGCGTSTYNGIVYNSSTIVRDTFRTVVNNCDSLIRVVFINITPLTVFNDTTRLNGCNKLEFNGVTYYSNDTIRTSLLREDSCIRRNSVLIITINPYTVFNDTTRVNGCDSIFFNNVWYRNNDTLRTSTLREDSCVRRNFVTIITVNTTPNVSINNSNLCAANQILTIGGAGLINIASVNWSFNGTPITTARRGWNGMGQVVAGATGLSGSALNRLGDPHGVFVVGNDMYISDWNNNRILRWTIGDAAGSNIINGVSRPSNVFVDNNLNVFVTEYSGNRITRWAPNATSGTTVVSGLGNPRGMFIDANGRIIVSDRGNSTQSGILNQIVTPNTNNTNTVLQASAGLNIANIFGAGNQIYYASQFDNRIRTFTYNASGTIGTVSDLFTNNMIGVSLNAPWGIHVQGNFLYVTNNGSHNLQRFDLRNNTTPITIAGNGFAGSALNRFNVPNGVFADTRGRIFVADGNNHRVLMFDSTYEVTATQTGTYTATITFANGCTRTVSTTVIIPGKVRRDTSATLECGSYTFRGVTYTSTTTVATDTLRTINGCDSIINYLHIQITPWTTTFDTITRTRCDTVMYNGISYSSSTVIRDTIVDPNKLCTRLIRTIRIIIRTAQECACLTNSISLNTGLNVNGQLKPSLQYDDNWTIVGGPLSFSSNYNNPIGAFVINSTIQNWGNTLPNSQWITPTTNANFAGTNDTPFVFRRTICGITTAGNYNLNLTVLGDDSCSVFLDGVLIAQHSNAGYNWQSNNQINISQQVYLTATTHTIEVRLTNDSRSPLGINCSGSISTINGDQIITQSGCCSNRGIISGFKFRDNNFNRTYETSDALLNNFTIQLRGTGGNVLATAITNNYGQYTFANIPAGNYIISEVQQTGYIQTFPANNANHTVTVTAGTVTQANFGNALPTNTTQNVIGCNPFTYLGRTFTANGSFNEPTVNNLGIVTSITTYNVVVTNPVTPTVSISASQTNICSGSSAILTATTVNAGTNPTYQWFRNGVLIVGATASTYTVTSAASNNNASFYCLITVDPSVTCVTKPTAQSNTITTRVFEGTVTPTINIQSSNGSKMVCSGVNVLFTSTITNGGTNPQYQWFINNVAVNGATNSTFSSSTLNNGDMVSCRLTSNANCVTTAIANSNMITMNVGAVIPLTAFNGPGSLCVNGANATFTASPIGGVWSSSVVNIVSTSSNSTSSIAIVRATSAGSNGWVAYTITHPISKCESRLTQSVVAIAQPAVPTIGYAINSQNPQAGAPAGSFCRNINFDITGTPAGGTWTSTNVSVTPLTSSNARVNTTTNAASGSITYTVSANGCSNSRTITGNLVTCAWVAATPPIGGRGINKNNNNGITAVIIYPNPAKDVININLDNLAGEGKAVLVDMLGKQIKQIRLSLGSNRIETTGLAKGMYVLNIITGNGVKTEKVIIE